MKTIPLSRPDITQKEINAVVSVLRSPYLSLGPKLPEFEEKFAKYIGSKYAVAVSSGTSGLHLAIRVLGIHEGDEVITTPFSFIASANSILFEKAKPVFVDINGDTLNINEELIEEKITSRTKAILVVHVFGYPCNMAKILRIARKYNLKVIEDSCEGLGARIGKRKIGTWGDMGVFAFYPNKQMTTGEGGIVVTNSKKNADLLRSLRSQGRDVKANWLAHTRLGYNYRLSDISCSLGIAQLSRIESILKKRESIARTYTDLFQKIDKVSVLKASSKDIIRSWFVYVIILKKTYTRNMRNQIVRSLIKKGISCNIYFPPIHLQLFYKKMYGYRRGDFTVTESVSDRTIAIPFYNKITANHIHRVVNTVYNVLQKSLWKVN